MDGQSATRSSAMTDRNKACMLAYKELAIAIIDSAMDDLCEYNPSASKFFGSDWFSYLCKVGQVNNLSLRSAAYRMPGFVPLNNRRSLNAIPRDKAIAYGRRRRPRGKPMARLMAIPPEGEPFAINGYVNAARMLGCTAAAVKIATDQDRPCLGWRFKKCMEAFK